MKTQKPIIFDEYCSYKHIEYEIFISVAKKDSETQQRGLYLAPGNHFALKLDKYESGQAELRILIFRGKQYVSFGFNKLFNLKEHVYKGFNIPAQLAAKLLIDAAKKSPEIVLMEFIESYLNKQMGYLLQMSIASLRQETGQEHIDICFPIGTYAS